MGPLHTIGLLAIFAIEILSVPLGVIFVKDGTNATPYFMSDEDIYNISTSHDFCDQYNGTLIILDTAEKFGYVTSLLIQHVTEPDKMYVNAEQTSGKRYTWANGVAVNSSFWGRDNPAVDKRFVQLRFRKGSFHLLSAHGTYQRYVLCEHVAEDVDGYDTSQVSILSTSEMFTASDSSTPLDMTSTIEDIQTTSDPLSPSDWSTRMAISPSIQDFRDKTSEPFTVSDWSTPLDILPTTQDVSEMISDPTTQDVSEMISDPFPVSDWSTTSHTSPTTDGISETTSEQFTVSDWSTRLDILPSTQEISEVTAEPSASDLVITLQSELKSSTDYVTTSWGWLDVESTWAEFGTSVSRSQLGTFATPVTSLMTSVSLTWSSAQDDAVSSAEKGNVITTVFDDPSSTRALVSPSQASPLSAGLSSSESVVGSAASESDYSLQFSPSNNVSLSVTSAGFTFFFSDPSLVVISASSTAATQTSPSSSLLPPASSVSTHVLYSPSSPTSLDLFFVGSSLSASLPTSSMFSEPPSPMSSSFQPSTLLKSLSSSSTSASSLAPSSVTSATSPSSPAPSSSTPSPSSSSSSSPLTSTWPSSTSSPSGNGNGKCRCQMITTSTGSAATLSNIKLKVAETKAELTVDRDSLSKAVRKLSSASDPRLSSRAAGILSVSILIGIAVGVLCLDLVSLCRYFELKGKTRPK